MIITNGKIVLKNKILQGYSIFTKNGKIIEISDRKILSNTNEKIYDVNGNYISPGLVDIHNHGGYGFDYMDASNKAFENILKFQLDNGITSIFASTVTAPIIDIENTIQVARNFYKKNNGLTRLYGVHLEGPYLSIQNKGAHKQEYLRVPLGDDYKFILDNKDIIKNVTIAPELENCVNLVKALVNEKIIVSGGHDNAILPEILPIVKAGMSNLTHLYCAMSGITMRNNIRYVGLREYGLINDNLYAEIIADNHHMPSELVKIIYKCKGADKICVVSDCLRAGGMKEDGRLYNLGANDDKNSQKFKVENGVAIIEDGTKFAGSIQSISQMVANLVFDCDIPLIEAIKMASLTPAKIMKIDDEVGSIEIGKNADFCIFNNNLKVENTIINEIINRGIK